MPAPHERLAASLEILKTLQEGGRRVFRSSEFRRADRERLLTNGFVGEVMKGWLISTGPLADEGDTTPWYASFWEFCALYCRDRFEDQWHLSPEQSIILGTELAAIPKQVVIYTPKGANNTVSLLFGTTLYDLKQKEMPPAEDLMERDGLRVFTPEAALVKVSDAFFQQHPIEAQVALGAVRDASAILGRLLDGGRSVVAGRIAGAFRRVNRAGIADAILRSMRAAGYEVRESDPFELVLALPTLHPGRPAIVGRLQTMWHAQRDGALEAFMPVPGLPKDQSAYMRRVDGIYQADAYHSLSIEGYIVTPDLIDRVRQGAWDPAVAQEDRQSRDALAARGYWQAFQQVKVSVEAILAGASPGETVRDTYVDWYRELFQPSVAAGLVRPGALAGFRNHPVYIRGSRHVPPRVEALPDGMDALFDLLCQEPEPAVRAVLGHWLLGYIHPFPDGNGRMARFLMNAMLASGGFPWTVIRVSDRAAYMAGLERASAGGDAKPFARFLADRVAWSVDSDTGSSADDSSARRG